MSRERYNTEQLQIILEAIKTFEGNFTIKQLEEKLGERVGPATIYRQVKKLIAEGRIKKQLIDDETHYCYIQCEHDDHFNLLCKKCGKIQHVECGCLADFSAKISKEHNFLIDSKLIISGLCEECANEQKA